MYVIPKGNKEMRLNSDDIKETLNIEEDFDGADVLTFVCPLCGKTHKSRIFKRR
jgi:hypothetical protein